MSEKPEEEESEDNKSYTLPDKALWDHVAKLAIVDDKPIMMDYWTDSFDNKALIGVRDTGEKLLVKNAEEYTSPIAKIYKVDEAFIICTENSIYLTSSTIATRKIS